MTMLWTHPNETGKLTQCQIFQMR
ncbi:hypothetical protein A2U01_0103214, partial [Trifolium medium]|nr:hypothetical protein [Trifolium medium]